MTFASVILQAIPKFYPKSVSAKETYNSSEVKAELDTKSELQIIDAQPNIKKIFGPEERIELSVPLIKQENSLTCEVASMQMVLKYYDIDNTQKDLLYQIGYSEPLQPFFIGDKMYWADPDLGFVGDSNGEVYDKSKGSNGATGFGVNSVPVLKLLKTYYTPSGKEVTLIGEHVNVVIGKYLQNNQVIYILNDPLYGRLEKSQEEIEKIWSAYNNMAISSGK